MKYGKWIAMIMFLDITHNLSENVADVIPHYDKVVDDFTRILYCPIISCMPPAFPVHLKVTYAWLSTGHLLLDSNHARLSKDLYMSHGTPLAGRSHRKSTKSRVYMKSFPLEVHKYNECPIHLL